MKTLAANQEVEVNIEYHSFMKKLAPTTLKDLESNKKEEKVADPPPQE